MDAEVQNLRLDAVKVHPLNEKGFGECSEQQTHFLPSWFAHPYSEVYI